MPATEVLEVATAPPTAEDMVELRWTSTQSLDYSWVRNCVDEKKIQDFKIF